MSGTLGALYKCLTVGSKGGGANSLQQCFGGALRVSVPAMQKCFREHRKSTSEVLRATFVAPKVNKPPSPSKGDLAPSPPPPKLCQRIHFGSTPIGPLRSGDFTVKIWDVSKEKCKWRLSATRRFIWIRVR